MYNANDLNEMTLFKLRALCNKEGIIGMSKKRKEIVIEALMSTNSKKSPVVKEENNKNKSPKSNFQEKKNSLNVNLAKNVTEDIKISVSCGAASQDFPIVGKSVSRVTAILSDIMGIPVLPKILVKGKEVDGSYILHEGDNLEYIKDSGIKG